MRREAALCHLRISSASSTNRSLTPSCTVMTASLRRAGDRRFHSATQAPSVPANPIPNPEMYEAGGLQGLFRHGMILRFSSSLMQNKCQHRWPLTLASKLSPHGTGHAPPVPPLAMARFVKPSGYRIYGPQGPRSSAMRFKGSVYLTSFLTSVALVAAPMAAQAGGMSRIGTYGGNKGMNQADPTASRAIAAAIAR